MISSESTNQAESVCAEAREHLCGSRWTEAADILGQLPRRELPVELSLNLARNLAAVREYRPDLYATLTAAEPSDRYFIASSRRGSLTIFFRQEDGTETPLSYDCDPLGALTAVYNSAAAEMAGGEPVAITGLGDGYLLKTLAEFPPSLAFGRGQPVYVFEPDPRVVLAAMMLHDYSTDDGPIRQKRFAWFVGADWLKNAHHFFENDLYNPCPNLEVGQSLRQEEITRGLRQIVARLASITDQYWDQIHAAYGKLSRAEILAPLSGSPPRKPRVLLLTTRCSSVLRYSTIDAAEGFAQIGFDAQVFIEPTEWQSLTAPKLLQMLLEFRPDLVVQIDHLRSEWQYGPKPIFPPTLPFVCWAQDHLSSLLNRPAAATVGPRDFVFSGMPSLHVQNFGYPQRQCHHIARYTRIPSRPASWTSQGEDLCYVSSASKLPEQVIQDILNDWRQSPDAPQLINECCRRMLDLYAADRSLPTPHAVANLIRAVERDLRRECGEETRFDLIESLFTRLNNQIYRQQSLRWAKTIAAKHKLRLGIYGPGWSDHPEFRDFARGPVAYGPDLEKLTRDSKINLVLEPTTCFSHQRLLDGLVAGGFYLVRHHPCNTFFQEMLNFILDHVPDSAQSVAEARQAVDPQYREQFEKLAAQCPAFDFAGDMVQYLRGAFDSEKLVRQDQAIDNLNLISFDGPEQMERRVLEFVADEPRRREISGPQRMGIESRLSYAAGMKRIVRIVHQTITGEMD